MTNNNNENLRNAKVQKMRKQKMLSIVFMAVTFVGALGVGICLLLSELLYPDIESLFACPAWYQIFMYVSFAVAVGGIVGCGFAKNSSNTTKFECQIELALFMAGLTCEIVCALARSESYWLDVLICIGGAISSIGFFCGIGSLIGWLKKPKGVYANIYRNLITNGTLNYKNFPKNQPASLLNVMEVEKYFGAMLPNELVYFLLEFNGDGDLLFPANEIVETSQSVRETFKNTTFEGVDKFCFFGGDGAGNYFCYKILENGLIEDGKIFLWNHETNETKLVATTLPELIDKYYNGKIN